MVISLLKSRFLLTAGITVLLLISACHRDETVAEKPEEVTPEPVKTEKISAVVIGDSLRVRSGPYLDSEVVGRLFAGDRIAVEVRTEWTETIGSLISHWFFVRSDSISGWTFGGYLDFGNADFLSIPRDPGLVPRTVTVTKPVDSGQSATPLNTDSLPEILLPIFGIEEPVRFENHEEGNISYDPINELLVIPYFNTDESRLAGFSRGTDAGLLRIVAKTAGTSGFNRTYTSGEVRLLGDDGKGGDKAILVPFYRLATLEDGDWEIYAFLGEENWPVAVGKVDIPTAEVSLLPVRDPDPLKDSPHSRYRAGQTVYCFVRQKNVSGTMQFAIYHETGEYREGNILLKPVLAYQYVSVASGKWSIEFRLDQHLPEGKYWAALGNPISGSKNLKLFITSINL